MITTERANRHAGVYRAAAKIHAQNGCQRCAAVFELGSLACLAASWSARHGFLRALRKIGDGNVAGNAIVILAYRCGS